MKSILAKWSAWAYFNLAILLDELTDRVFDGEFTDWMLHWYNKWASRWEEEAAVCRQTQEVLADPAVRLAITKAFEDIEEKGA